MPQKFLIIRFSSIGDIVLTTPVIRCLKQQVPGAAVHFLTKPQFRSILEHNPYIDHLHVLDKPLAAKALELKQQGFDAIFDLHHNLRTRLLKAIIDVPAFSFDKLNTEKWWLVKAKIDTLPAVHIVDRYLKTTEGFGVINDDVGLDYFFPPAFAPVIPEVQDHLPYIAFAIGAQHATKRLPNEKLISICRKLPLPVLLLGGKEDAANGAQIAAASGPHVKNLCGHLSLHESAFVVKHAQQVFTHDTGLMHIAAAFKKEIVSVWGNTVPEFGMTPYYGKHPVKNFIAEVKDLSCRPCSKIGYTQCPLGHFRCMVSQDIDQIIHTAYEPGNPTPSFSQTG